MAVQTTERLQQEKGAPRSNQFAEALDGNTPAHRDKGHTATIITSPANHKEDEATPPDKKKRTRKPVDRERERSLPHYIRLLILTILVMILLNDASPALSSVDIQKALRGIDPDTSGLNSDTEVNGGTNINITQFEKALAERGIIFTGRSSQEFDGNPPQSDFSPMTFDINLNLLESILPSLRANNTTDGVIIGNLQSGSSIPAISPMQAEDQGISIPSNADTSNGTVIADGWILVRAATGEHAWMALLNDTYVLHARGDNMNRSILGNGNQEDGNLPIFVADEGDGGTNNNPEQQGSGPENRNTVPPQTAPGNPGQGTSSGSGTGGSGGDGGNDVPSGTDGEPNEGVGVAMGNQEIVEQQPGIVNSMTLAEIRDNPEARREAFGLLPFVFSSEPGNEIDRGLMPERVPLIDSAGNVTFVEVGTNALINKDVNGSVFMEIPGYPHRLKYIEAAGWAIEQLESELVTFYVGSDYITENPAGRAQTYVFGLTYFDRELPYPAGSEPRAFHGEENLADNLALYGGRNTRFPITEDENGDILPPQELLNRQAIVMYAVMDLEGQMPTDEQLMSYLNQYQNTDDEMIVTTPWGESWNLRAGIDATITLQYNRNNRSRSPINGVGRNAFSVGPDGRLQITSTMDVVHTATTSNLLLHMIQFMYNHPDHLLSLRLMGLIIDDDTLRYVVAPLAGQNSSGGQVRAN